MSRWIDADAIRELLIKYIGLTNGFDRAFSEAPSIDIVRCKECKHNPWDFDRTDYTCVWDDDFADRPQTPDDFCSYGERAEQTEQNSSEKPNNCEHITEDGVTCAKYPACDDCPNNPLNKVKGSERLLKGKGEPQTDCAWR